MIPKPRLRPGIAEYPVSTSRFFFRRSVHRGRIPRTKKLKSRLWSKPEAIRGSFFDAWSRSGNSFCMLRRLLVILFSEFLSSLFIELI